MSTLRLASDHELWGLTPTIEPWDAFTGAERPGTVVEITPDRLKSEDFPKNMGAGSHGGYLYCVSFDNDVHKVGYTTTPARRVSVHRAHSRHFGIEPVRAWISAAHGSYWELEAEMIRHLSSHSERVAPESFRGPDVMALARNWWSGQKAYPPGETAQMKRKRLGI